MLASISRGKKKFKLKKKILYRLVNFQIREGSIYLNAQFFPPKVNEIFLSKTFRAVTQQMHRESNLPSQCHITIPAPSSRRDISISSMCK